MIVLDPQILSSLPSYSPQETGPYFARLLTDTKVSPMQAELPASVITVSRVSAVGQSQSESA